MRILVVGSRGFVGRFLTDALVRRGDEIVTLDRGEPPPTSPVDAVIDANGDARRFWAESHPGESFQANMASVAERVSRLRYSIYVFLSTVDVYGRNRENRACTREDSDITPEGMDTYAFHKWLAERFVAFHARRHLILRLGTLLGPGLKKNPVFDALSGLPIRQTAASTLNLVHLETVAEALARLLAAGAGGVWNVAACAPITVAAMLQSATPGRTHPFHPELLSTSYDIEIEKVSSIMPMPSSADALACYLSGSR